jgi:hypothetical protein
MTLLRRGWRGVVGPLVLSLILPVGIGCDTSYAKLTGVVRLNGQGLPGGRLTFRPADPRQNTLTVPIHPDGNYEATLPVGEVAISVDNRELAPPPPEPPLRLPRRIDLPMGEKEDEPAATATTEVSKLPGRYVEISATYYEVETSGLTWTVQKDAGPHDIVLK